jgi:hypothetical protein
MVGVDEIFILSVGRGLRTGWLSNKLENSREFDYDETLPTSRVFAGQPAAAPSPQGSPQWEHHRL